MCASKRTNSVSSACCTGQAPSADGWAHSATSIEGPGGSQPTSWGLLFPGEILSQTAGFRREFRTGVPAELFVLRNIEAAGAVPTAISKEHQS